MALAVHITRAINLAPDRVFVQWDLSGASAPGVYVFQLYRGHSPRGPWLLLSSNRSQYSHLDVLSTTPTVADASGRTVNMLSLARDFYYRVVVTPPEGVSGQVEVVSTVEPQLDGRQKNARRKMLRDEAVLLKKGNGVPVAVCKKARWGERCARCTDATTGEIIRGECLMCYGTGFVPGYHTPVITWARRSPAAVQSQMTPSGKVDVNQLQITMLDAPMVQDDDMLVFLRDNRRFIVKQAGSTELRTVTVHQEVVASELARSSIEYRFLVDPTTLPALF